MYSNALPALLAWLPCLYPLLASCFIEVDLLQTNLPWSQVDKGISETKSKQQNPCSNCMHQPVMSWGNACSICMYKHLRCMHQSVHHRPMHALTAWDLKFQVCLGYTLTPATLALIILLLIDICDYWCLEKILLLTFSVLPSVGSQEHYVKMCFYIKAILVNMLKHL
jgi:hypothetical protein